VNSIRKAWEHAAADVVGGHAEEVGMTAKPRASQVRKWGESLQRSNSGWKEACGEEQGTVEATLCLW